MRIAKLLFGIVILLFLVSCVEKNSPLSPSFFINPEAATVIVGQSQIFTISGGNDVTFRMSSDGGDWHQFVKASGQSSNAIQLTGLKSTGGGKVYVTASLGDDAVVASLRVVP